MDVEMFVTNCFCDTCVKIEALGLPSEGHCPHDPHTKVQRPSCQTDCRHRTV